MFKSVRHEEMRLMKILYITNYPAPYAVDFFNELGKDCALTVMFLEDVAFVDGREKSWFSSEAKNFNAIFIGNKNRRQISFKAAKMVAGYDLVFMGEYSSMSEMYLIRYMRRKKIRYAFSIDGGIKKSGRGFKEKLKRYLLKGAPLYMSSGKMTDEYLTFYGAKKENIRRYPFTSLCDGDIIPAPLARGEKLAIRQELNMSESNIAVCVGQFIPRKGFDVLIRAAAKADKNIGFYIIGGESPEEYKRLAAALGADNVKFISFKSKKELKKYYLSADLFVLPTREDIWGLVVNEAMACALPVVTTQNCVAGVELVANGKNGYIVPVDDDAALLKGVERVLSDDETQQKMAEESLKRIKGYTVKNMAAAHIKAAKELCEK